MVTTKSIVTFIDKAFISNIKDLSAENVEFKNIYFGCESITDAGGIRFVRERTCHYVDDDGLMGACSLCGEPMGEAHHFCPWCGAKVIGDE